MIHLHGTVRYGPGWMATVELDRELGRYYHSLIPKYLDAKPQAHGTHCTLVRLGRESPCLTDWLYRDGERVELRYLPLIHYRAPYFYLEAFSPEMGEIRLRLGLPEYREGFSCYHITIANTKRLAGSAVSLRRCSVSLETTWALRSSNAILER